MNGPFDYNATPIAPPGIKTIVYKTPQQRKTWFQHGVDAWYIGYCPDHYRCYKTYVPATRVERVLQHRYLHTPLKPAGDKEFAAIQALENIFCPNIQYQATQAPIHTPMEPTEIAPLLQQIQQSTSVDLSPTLQEHPGSNVDGHIYPTRYSLF